MNLAFPMNFKIGNTVLRRTALHAVIFGLQRGMI